MSENLQVRISEGVGQRLRHAVALAKRRPGELVEELLDAGLPTTEEIAAQLTRKRQPSPTGKAGSSEPPRTAG